MSDEAAPQEATYRVAARSLLIDDRIYVRGDLVSSDVPGKHLIMLVRAGQLVPLDPNSTIEKRQRKKGLARLLSKLRRMF